MKIEKISNNQIRCTLTADDLLGLDMKMSELAYGSDKARILFREMMVKARNEYGFEAENVPLMIEAVPGGKDSLILIITKVEDPEELDTRFSHFSPTLQDGHAPVELDASGADDIVGMYKNAREASASAQKKKGGPDQSGSSDAVPVDLIRLYTFDDIDTVIAAAGIVSRHYSGSNSLYRSRSKGRYLLTVHKSHHTPEEFNRVCNTLSEYGRVSECTPALEAHLDEHEESVLRGSALQELSLLR